MGFLETFVVRPHQLISSNPQRTERLTVPQLYRLPTHTLVHNFNYHSQYSLLQQQNDTLIDKTESRHEKLASFLKE